MTFGEKVRRLRKEKGWTQAELAKLSGLSLRTIISYEKGESYPKKRSTYDVLAEIFEIPSVELRSETDELDFQNLPEIPESMMEVIRIFNDRSPPPLPQAATCSCSSTTWTKTSPP